MKKFLLYASLTTAVFAAGCDDFGDTNESPNAGTTPLTSALLTNSLSQIGTSVTGGPALASGFYAQYFAQTQYTETSLYTELDANWAIDIAGPIADLKRIIDINSDPKTAAIAATQGSNANQIAIARILKAYRFSVLTDRYGDMPYKETLDEKNLTPVFDTQEEIYKDIFKELDEAAAQFDGGLAVKGDILFGGDPVKWQKFANSLRMILALRVSKVNDQLGKLQYLDAYGAGTAIISNNADNAEITYPGGAFKNPWFAIAGDQAIANTVVDYLEIGDDRRKFSFGKVNSSGDLVGFDYGLIREKALAYAAKNPTWSKILDDPFRTETSKLFILTYADVLMARAEASQKGWTAGIDNATGLDPVDPTQAQVAIHDKLFRAAVEASWKQWGVYIRLPDDNPDVKPKDDEPDFDNDQLDSAAQVRVFNYVTDFKTEFPNAAERIATQRWITFYPNGPQGWSEWRRTGFPNLTPTPAAVNVSKQIPTRFKYPSVEYGYNADNINTAAGRFDAGDNDNSHVWWDK